MAWAYEYKQQKQQGKENKSEEFQAYSWNKGKEWRKMRQLFQKWKIAKLRFATTGTGKPSNEKAWEALQLLCLGSSPMLHIWEI